MSLKWRRVDSPVPGARGLQAEVSDGHLSVLVGQEPPGWHLSISHRVEYLGKTIPGRYPTWDEISEARYLFCPDDITMAMLLPPRAEYVNVHPTTFHLWEVEGEDAWAGM